MSRPEFPRCILPVNCIRRIREEQEYYDENPERYEREQREREEQRILEEEEMYQRQVEEKSNANNRG